MGVKNLLASQTLLVPTKPVAKKINACNTPGAHIYCMENTNFKA